MQVTGPGAGEPVLVSRQWLTDTATTATVQVAPCHPVTGALLDHLPPASRTTAPRRRDRPDRPHRRIRRPADTGRAGLGVAHGFGATAYTPSKAMAKRIRARDRRCRFPGCSVAAVFCDLDHVRPWPAGPTHDTNLLTVCRRHHRVKQRPGWTVTLTPDGIATWIDPTGRARTSHPVDALTHRDPDRASRYHARHPAPAAPAPSSPTAPTPSSSTASNTTAHPHPGSDPPHPRPGATTTDTRHRIDLLPTIATITVAHHTWRWPPPPIPNDRAPTTTTRPRSDRASAFSIRPGRQAGRHPRWSRPRPWRGRAARAVAALGVVSAATCAGSGTLGRE